MFILASLCACHSFRHVVGCVNHQLIYQYMVQTVELTGRLRSPTCLPVEFLQYLAKTGWRTTNPDGALKTAARYKVRNGSKGVDLQQCRTCWTHKTECWPTSPPKISTDPHEKLKNHSLSDCFLCQTGSELLFRTTQRGNIILHWQGLLAFGFRLLVAETSEVLTCELSQWRMILMTSERSTWKTKQVGDGVDDSKFESHDSHVMVRMLGMVDDSRGDMIWDLNGARKPPGIQSDLSSNHCTKYAHYGWQALCHLDPTCWSTVWIFAYL